MSSLPIFRDSLTSIPVTEFSSASLVLLSIFYLAPQTIPSWQTALSTLFISVIFVAFAEVMAPYATLESVYKGVCLYLRAMTALVLRLVQLIRYGSKLLLAVIAWAIYYEATRIFCYFWKQIIATRVSRLLTVHFPRFYILGCNSFDDTTLKVRQIWSVIVAICHISISRIMQELCRRFSFHIRVTWWLYRWIVLPIAVVAWIHFLIVTFILHQGELEALCFCVMLLLWILSKLKNPIS
ncbi:hypothetical protein PT974_09080 [Cladobotryum mycophilum]|uniref:Uncharacterized protein n=1 Tax=Cladobotryum mycophilum TaxID=491253 RepID=A0ABR0SF51_9HYPO